MKLNKILLTAFFAIISFSSSLCANKWIEAGRTGNVPALIFYLRTHGPFEVFRHFDEIWDAAAALGHNNVFNWLEDEFPSETTPHRETTVRIRGFDIVDPLTSFSR